MYKGALYQRGYGLGGTFRRFFSWIMPIVQKHTLPVLNQGLREIGKSAVLTAADIAKDSISGRDIKESAQERLNLAIDDLKGKAEKKLSGQGIKRKNKSNKKIILVKKRKKDIFD